MKEGALERRRHPRQLTDREIRHKAFVESGGFDKLLLRMKPLQPEDRVVIREKATIGTVREITGDSVSIHFEEGDGDAVARVTRNVRDVRLAEDYEKAIREQ